MKQTKREVAHAPSAAASRRRGTNERRATLQLRLALSLSLPPSSSSLLKGNCFFFLQESRSIYISFYVPLKSAKEDAELRGSYVYYVIKTGLECFAESHAALSAFSHPSLHLRIGQIVAIVAIYYLKYTIHVALVVILRSSSVPQCFPPD